MEPHRGLEWHEMARRCRGRDAESLRCCVLGLEVRRERATRIELAFSAWEADVLPLNYARENAHTLHAG